LEAALSKQVVSRYEETEYQTVAISRLQEILDAIGIKALVALSATSSITPSREANILRVPQSQFQIAAQTQRRADLIVPKVRAEILTNIGDVAHWVR
jgi:hypothetical protein